MFGRINSVSLQFIYDYLESVKKKKKNIAALVISH